MRNEVMHHGVLGVKTAGASAQPSDIIDGLDTSGPAWGSLSVPTGRGKVYSLTLGDEHVDEFLQDTFSGDSQEGLRLQKNVSELGHVLPVIDEVPSAFIHSKDKDAFFAEVNTRLARHESGDVNNRVIAEKIGITDTMLGLYLRGGAKELKTHITQKLCLLLNIRFNYLPYSGEPLSHPQKIVSSLVSRVAKDSQHL